MGWWWVGVGGGVFSIVCGGVIIIMCGGGVAVDVAVGGRQAISNTSITSGSCTATAGAFGARTTSSIWNACHSMK